LDVADRGTQRTRPEQADPGQLEQALHDRIGARQGRERGLESGDAFGEAQ